LVSLVQLVSHQKNKTNPTNQKLKRKQRMYYPYFIAYMAAGFVISIAVFVWALNNGQFKDQQRARFIPLESDRNAIPLKKSRFARLETYALFSLACIGLATSVVVITFALLKAIR